jgi:hypothetical protein
VARQQFRPIPYGLKLAPTLAQRVNQLREVRNMTVRDLANSSKLVLQRIEDIEGGMETWLSVTDRQLLARALGVEPHVLQEVECRTSTQTNEVVYSFEQDLSLKILEGQREIDCPNCGGPLKCSVQQALDMDGNPVRFPKAFCTKCPFILK